MTRQREWVGGLSDHLVQVGVPFPKPPFCIARPDESSSRGDHIWGVRPGLSTKDRPLKSETLGSGDPIGPRGAEEGRAR